ncbi:hypothetical protein IFT62_01485 [Pseudomonas lutea]|uniref:Glycosyl hydrolase n=1 Tax=Pseudomonas lutea TaxID=243924 RepID=A0ABR9A1E4_9PSED|nr:hypothetical protein [Pseudomonas lutea]MBD8119878.1 hypothetical protein [Pseudomonas lutea]
MSEQLIKASSAVLNPIDAPNGATARVAYTPMLSTDNIMLVWDGNDAMIGSQPGSTDGTVDFAIPAGVVAESLGKTVDFFYKITRDGEVWPSKPLNLTVLPLDVSDLAASRPAVVESSNGALDPNTFEGDAHVAVAKWPLAAVGQKVWLTVKGPNDIPTLRLLVAHPLDEAQAASGVAVTLPRADLLNVANGDEITLIFSVAFDGTSNAENSVEFPPLTLMFGTTPLIIDNSPLVLDGFYVISDRLASTGRVPPGVRVTRPAAGGKPPYVYTCDPAYLKIDAKGKITKLRNGTGNITVRDANGETVTFPFTASNTWKAVWVAGEGDTYATALLIMRDRGGQPFTEAALENMKISYKQPFNWILDIDLPYIGDMTTAWTCATAGCTAGSAQVFNLENSSFSCANPASDHLVINIEPQY